MVSSVTTSETRIMNPCRFRQGQEAPRMNWVQVDLVIACGLMCSVYPIFWGCLSSLNYSCLGKVACILRLRSIGECIVMKKMQKEVTPPCIFTHLHIYEAMLCDKPALTGITLHNIVHLSSMKGILVNVTICLTLSFPYLQCAAAAHILNSISPFQP